MMIEVCAWLILVLGAGHTLVALLQFHKPLLAALAEGYWNRFAHDKARTHAFWFLLFGPLLMFLGYLSVYAVQAGNLELKKLVGGFVFFVAIAGAAAFPKSPFWVAMPLSLMLCFYEQ